MHIRQLRDFCSSDKQHCALSNICGSAALKPADETIAPGALVDSFLRKKSSVTVMTLYEAIKSTFLARCDSGSPIWRTPCWLRYLLVSANP
jgi:hypothetical protein